MNVGYTRYEHDLRRKLYVKIAGAIEALQKEEQKEPCTTEPNAVPTNIIKISFGSEEESTPSITINNTAL